MHMRGAVRFDVEIDACVNCYGIWFDEGEMRAYAQNRIDASQENHEPQEPPAPAPDAPVLECPRCQAMNLKTWWAGEMEMNRCSDCSGIYLPFRTHDRIFARPKRAEPTRVAKEGSSLANEAAWSAGDILTDTFADLSVLWTFFSS